MTCQEFLSIVQKGVREFPCEKAVRELREANQISTSCRGDHYLSVSPEKNLAKALALAGTLHPDCRLRFFRSLTVDLWRARHPELTEKVFEKWLDLAKALENEPARVLDLNQIGFSLERTKRPLKNAGLTLWNRLFDTAQKIKDETLRLKTLSTLAAGFNHAGFTDRALAIFGGLLDAAEKRADKKDRILSINMISGALSTADAKENSRALFNRIHHWVRNLPSAHDRQIQMESLHRDLGRAELKDLQACVASELGW